MPATPSAAGVGIIIDGLGQFPDTISANVDLVNPVVAQNPTFAPYRRRIMSARLRVNVVPDVAGLVSLGRRGATTAYSLGITVATTTAVGDVITFPMNGAEGSLIAANDVFIITGDGGATAVGNVDVCIVIAPDPV